MLIALGLFARLRSKANNTRTAAPTSKQYTEGNFPLRCLFTRQEPLSLPTPLSLLRSLFPPLSLSLPHQNFSLAARSLRHRLQLLCLHFPSPVSEGSSFTRKILHFLSPSNGRRFDGLSAPETWPLGFIWRRVCSLFYSPHIAGIFSFSASG